MTATETARRAIKSEGGQQHQRSLDVQLARVQRLRGWKTMVVESVLPIEALAVKETEMASFVR